MVNAASLVPSHDVFFVTLDTLRYDVAAELFASNRTPHFARVHPAGWEKRHTPATFTFAAHAAFFAGFLPTPAAPGQHPRLFALQFPGSETTTPETCAFDAPDIVTGFRERGYRTVCIGGVGFFNKLSPLGSVLPALFEESYWSPALGVTEPRSTEYQIDLALGFLEQHERPLFLFVNVSALHQPNAFYLPGATEDSLASHAAALEYVDGELARLWRAVRRPTLVVICSDHGTAYGEDGYHGHRLAHPVVWDVPYAEFVLMPGSVR